jgi:hydroxyacylglutathione hydrolase
MDVYRLPVLNDNYVFVLHDRQANVAAVVDPAVPQPVLAKLKELNAPLIAIFNTHHHYDHVGANQALIKEFPDLVVYGGELDKGRIPGQQVFLKDGDRVSFANETAEVFFVPGHTRAHIAYYFPESGNLFCGDTLFAGGCGRLFEGTPAQMMHSLERLRQLPGDTKVWCAHEYTLKNLQFAVTVDRNNKALMERLLAVKNARARGEATIPTTIAIERQTNPFLRWDQPALQDAVKIKDPVRVFARIRGKKDMF